MSVLLSCADAARALVLSDTKICPVCRANAAGYFESVDGRDYFSCRICEAWFLDVRFRLPRDEEHAHYRTHENFTDDPRYRQFLSKLWEPLKLKLAPSMCGLDFGCGSGPALGAMMREEGHNISLYDSAFYPDCGALSKSYDFITCSEVVEHLHDPFKAFAQFNSILRPGGWLGVMTRFQPSNVRFADWYYRKDPTHVVFYGRKTFEVISDVFDWTCEIPVNDVVLMQKRGLVL